MGKAGRIACIFTPWALTIASFACLLLISIGGWNKSSPELNSLYFFQADFSNLTLPSGSSLANSTNLTAALQAAQKAGTVDGLYQIHLWNYCTAKKGKSNGTTVDFCSKRESNFYFDPVEVWGLNATGTIVAAAQASATSKPEQNAIQNAADTLKNKSEALEKEILGKSGADALKAYKKVSKWMFIAFEVSFWSTAATILFGLLAIFSRWGSFITWILSAVSTLFTFAAVLTSTVLFSTLVGALKTLLDPYHVAIKLGTHALIVEWIGVACSLGATFFWLFSVCCCSGRSNPHHKTNKGGLWNAGNDNRGSYGSAYGNGRGRGLKVEKTGAGYERVSSPFLGHDRQADHVPMQGYAGGSSAPQYHQQQPQQGGAYEPFRHA